MITKFKNMANMIVKKSPERKCMGCNQKKPKKELIRILRTPEGNIELDITGKKSGRGAYICKSKSCFDKAYKTKRLEKCLETAFPEEVYESIKTDFDLGDED